MTGTTPRTSAVRQLMTFLHQTLRGRGLLCTREELESAMYELTLPQFQQVGEAAEAVARGSDRRDLLDVLSALRTVSLRTTRHALKDAGAIYRADVLYPLAAAATTSAEFSRNVGLLRNKDAPADDRELAKATLLQQCGPLSHEDLLPAASAMPTALAQGASHRPPTVPHAAVASAGAKVSAPGACQRQVRLHGDGVVLTWSTAAAHQGSPSSPGSTTILVEGASKQADTNADSSHEVMFRFGTRWLPRLLAALLGWTAEAEFTADGEGLPAKLSVRGAGHGVVVRLEQGNAVVAMPAVDMDCYALAMLVLQVLVDNEPGANAQTVLAVCRDVMCSPTFLQEQAAVPATVRSRKSPPG